MGLGVAEMVVVGTWLTVTSTLVDNVHPALYVMVNAYVPEWADVNAEITGSASVEVKPFGPLQAYDVARSMANPSEFNDNTPPSQMGEI